MNYVQVVLTDSQAALLRDISGHAAEDMREKGMPMELVDQVESLWSFFNHVASEPRAFPVNGNMARALKVRFRRIKGPKTGSTEERKRRGLTRKYHGRPERTARRKAAAKARRANRQG